VCERKEKKEERGILTATTGSCWWLAPTPDVLSMSHSAAIKPKTESYLRCFQGWNEYEMLYRLCIQ
jgi:hypothetical protein